MHIRILSALAKSAGWKYHSTIIWNEQNISRRTAWGSWLSASAPYVIAPVEAIVIMYKDQWKKNRKGISDITREEFLAYTNGMWQFNGENGKRLGHPAPFPTELPRRCIRIFSYVGDTVLDPFLGSGTTLISCYETQRIGIGVEINNEYCKKAADRLLNPTLFIQKKKRVKEELSEDIANSVIQASDEYAEDILGRFEKRSRKPPMHF